MLKETTFSFGKIALNIIFFNESNFKLSNKRFRLRINQGRRAHSLRSV